MRTLRKVLPLNRVASWTILSGVVASTVYIVIGWSLRRGFDWTDEGWAFSLTGTGEVFEGETWGFQHLLHPLFLSLGESVLAFRIVRLIAYVVLAVLSTIVLARVSALFGFKLDRSEWWFVLIFAQVGTFLAWSYPPRYFAYNELSGWFAQVGVLVVILLIAGAAANAPFLSARGAISLWAVAGILSVFLAITKFTGGVVLGVIVLAALIVGDAVSSWVARCLAALSGVGVGLLLLVATGFPLGQFVSNVVKLLVDPEAQAAAGHPLRSLLGVYKDSLFFTSQMIALPVAIFVVMVGLLLAYPSQPQGIRRLVTTVAGTFATLVVIVILTFPKIESHPSIGRFILLAAAFAVVALTLSSTVGPAGGSSGRRGLPILIGVVALVAAPFISAIGTNNFIAGQLLYSATAWMTFIAIALLFAARRIRVMGGRFAMIMPAFLLFFMVLSATQVLGETYRHPYRSTPYPEQTFSTTAPHFQGILLTEEGASWADWMAQQATDLKADGVPTVALSLPGALFVFNNSNFASSWIEGDWPATFNSVSAACREEEPRDLLVLQPGFVDEEHPSYRVLATTLETDCGLEFPGDFDVVARRYSDDLNYEMTIWRVQDSGSDQSE